MNMKIQKRVKLPLDEVNSGLKCNIQPSANIAIASVLAKWFDQIIRARRIIPNLKGHYVFGVLRSMFDRNTGGRSPSNQALKKALKEYGYKIKPQKSEVIITKYR